FSQPSSMSVQQSFELPSTGICFHEPNGQPLMSNNCMEQLCIKLTGEHLLDANELWETVRAVSRDRFIDANGDELYQVVLDEPTLADVESGGSTRAFAFTRRDFMMSGFPIFELKATDVSEQFALQRELEADNSRARDLNRRLAEYGSNVDAIIREREVLSARMAVHDEVGRNLIAAKRWLQANPAGAGTPIEAQAAQEAAQLQRDMTQSLRLMLASDDHAPSGTADNLQRLLDAAAAVGLSLEIEGEMPPIGSSARELLLAAMRECTTNAVRHANASVLRVRVDSLPDGYVARLDNNGTAPDGPVHEGGGLSSLRRLVEPMGGSMDLQWEPGFLLTLSVPNE
ncbi:MAG: hypothetical protein IJJ14_05360, partial [Coriobacteriales bacterium]|nr:hypothetical protein [Coriobacteriales bacterium]